MNPAILQRWCRQGGQALLWFIATAGTCAAVLFAVFNVGQLTSEKARLVNTADAAAYSAALVEARTLNFEAYLNRGIVADEVIIAQVVSLDSWVHYVDQLATRIATLTSWIPYVGQVTRAAQQIADRVTTIVDQVGDIAIPVTDMQAYNILPLAREAVHASTYVTMVDIARQVVAANTTTFGGRSDSAPYITNAGMAALAKNAVEWLNFTKQYSDDDRSYAKQVVLDSRDGFSKTRNGSILDFEIPFVAHGYKRGGTDLQGYDRWSAYDSYTFGTWDWGGLFHGPGWDDFTLAQGSATASENGDDSSGGRWWSTSSHAFSGFHGIPTIRDIADREALDEDTPNHSLALDFLIEVAKDDGNLKTSSKVGLGTGNSQQFNVSENLASGRISASSKARVYFERPSIADDSTAASLLRRDGKKEYGSLYNPYWQARLIDPSVADKALFYLGNSALIPFTP